MATHPVFTLFKMGYGPRKEAMMIDRQELQEIRDTAFDAVEDSENPAWKAAYAELGIAANRLCAMTERCTIPTTQIDVVD